jgi:hypothetical protein
MPVDLKDLERRVRSIENIEAIRLLRATYHKLINDGGFETIENLFTANAVVDFGYMAQYIGREAIGRGFSAMPGRVEFIKQFPHNHIVSVDGDRGTGSCYMEAKYGRAGASYIVAGRYDDEYARHDEGWLFSAMRFDAYFSLPLNEGWVGENRHFLSDNIAYTRRYLQNRQEQT